MVRAYRPLLILLFGLALLTPLASAQTAGLEPATIFQRAAPAIGVVRATRDGTTGLGTGFVVDARGVLVTASHVARNAERLVVEMGEGDPLDAELAGYDARRDLAVLRVRPRGALPFLEVGDSSAVKPGDPVVVIGTPRGRPRVMTTGEIRGTAISLSGLLPRIFLSFSAEVAPGNSGGPLLDGRGQVIGVVIALSRQPDGPVGLATSSAALRTVMPALAEGARLERAWIGISGTTVASDARQGRTAGRGVLVLAVVPEGPAAKAGLRSQNGEPPGDVIVAVDGEQVEEWDDLLSLLGDREPGQRIRLGILRDGRQLEVPVVLEARP